MGQYRIVDCDKLGYYLSVARGAGAKTVAHEGRLFRRATEYVVIIARFDWRALTIYCDSYAPRPSQRGQFMAISKGLWEKICALTTLPKECAYSNLRAAVTAARPLKPAVKPRRGTPAVDPKRPNQLLLFV
jgi:hypothetical protein